MAPIEMLVVPRTRDLGGGFVVRRILPYMKKRMVGPFIFLDHMGPVPLDEHQAMDVRPHPHIGLSTVTYLFEGRALHRDSLGSHQVIEPGAINWMTAGRGIAHSERTPPEMRIKDGGRLHGLQCWVALPREHEETEPAFSHHPADTLPEFEVQGARLKLLVGSLYGRKSPVPAFSDIFYAELKMNAGERLRFEGAGRESGLYVVDGSAAIGETAVGPGTLAIGRLGADYEIEVTAPLHAMMLGGAPLTEPREIWWNFVSSSKERIEVAKREWREGKFPKVPGDEVEFIPLPRE